MRPKRNSIPCLPPRDEDVILVVRLRAPPGSAQEHRGSGLDLAMVRNGSLLSSGLAEKLGAFQQLWRKTVMSPTSLLLPIPFPLQ